MPPSPQRQHGSSPSSSSGTDIISIIPSSDPSRDATFLSNLVPNRFFVVRQQQQEEGGNNGESVRAEEGVGSSPGATTEVIIITTDGNNDDEKEVSKTTATILFVNFGSHHYDNNAAPNATAIIDVETILSVAEYHKNFSNGINDDAKVVDNNNNNNSSSIDMIQGSSWSSTSSSRSCIDGDLSWSHLRLPGGGSILLAASTGAVRRFINGIIFSSSETDARLAIGNGGGDAAVVRYGQKQQQQQQRSEDYNPVSTKTDDGMDDEEYEPPYKFPSLSLSLLIDHQIIPGLRANTKFGIPIESNLFVGRILVIVRPPNSEVMDPYYHAKIFSKKKRHFEIQIQGRFKYVPRGTVWCGVEVNECMKLGLVSRGLCNLLLRLVSKTVPGDMHYSFGDKHDEELPHISGPAWTFFDKMVVTKPGDEPPILDGETLPETTKESSARKKSGSNGEFSPENIYSFSYNSMYFDFPYWRLVNLPTANMDLKTFWRDSALRIVVYENQNNGNNDSEKVRHLHATNKYIAGIQMEYLGFDDDDSINDDIAEKKSMPLDQTKLATISRSISSVNLNNVQENDAESKASAPSLSSHDVGLEFSFREDSNTLESDDEGDDDTVFYDARASVGADSEPRGNEIVITMDDTFNLMDNMLSFDMACPGWIDMCSFQRGKFTKVYAFANMNPMEATANDGNVIFRTGQEFAQLFPLSEGKAWAEQTWTPRLSNSEKHRRIMGYILAGGTNPSLPRFNQRWEALAKQEGCRFDNMFLCRKPPTDSASKMKETILHSGYLARALSERHWVEEWAIVTNTFVSFYRPGSKRPSYRIRRVGILGVSEMSRSDCPYFPSYHFLAVGTVSRVIYMMFRTHEESNDMMNILAVPKQSPSDISATNNEMSPLTFDDPTGEYMHKSSVYKCQQRRLLNNRTFSFNSLGKIGVNCREGDDHTHPLTLVQNILRKASHPSLMEGSDRMVLDDFLDAASELKGANLTGLNESEKCAFYINLYHVMVLHGFLLFGPPVSSFDFIAFFGKVAYEVGDDIFSIKELEHSIIRANMSSPSKFVSRFVLPKSTFKHALVKGDCRINFAINSGSLSNPDTIQIFTDEDLASQLDNAAREYLKVVKCSSSGKILSLPKIIQWYASDFGKRSQDVLRFVVNYLEEKDQASLPSPLSDVQIRYLGYEYKCRPFLLKPEL